MTDARKPSFVRWMARGPADMMTTSRGSRTEMVPIWREHTRRGRGDGTYHRAHEPQRRAVTKEARASERRNKQRGLVFFAMIFASMGLSAWLGNSIFHGYATDTQATWFLVGSMVGFFVLIAVIIEVAVRWFHRSES